MSIHFEEFVGRAGELNILVEVFQRANIGEGSVVWLVGDAGIGKTRLAAEFSERVRNVGGVAIVGQCLQFVSAPYLPFVDVFRSLFNDLPLIVKATNEPDRAASVRKTAGFAATLKRLRDHAEKKPLLLCIEDLHFSDSATLELIAYIGRHLNGARILLLLTARQAEPTSDNELTELMTVLSRIGAHVIRIGPLAMGDVHYLTQRALRGATEIPRRTLAQIEELAEGNPFFAEELLLSVAENQASNAGANIPLTVRSVIGKRLRSLHPQTRNILTFAAVIGREFDAAFLQQLAGVSQTAVLDALREAHVAQLIDQTGSNPQRFSYHHALSRTMIYDDLLEMERRSLHARVGQMLEEMPEDATRLFELAYHWAAAEAPSKALDYNERAGDAAARVFAYPDAARYYERALDFNPNTSERRASLCEKVAKALYSGNITNDTSSWFKRALSEYSRLGDTRKMAEMLIAMSRQSWNDAETESGITLASRALDLLATTPDPSLHAFANVMIASYYSVLGRPEQTMRYLSLVSVQERNEDPNIGARFYDSRALARLRQGDMSGATADFEAAMRAADCSGDPDLIARVYVKYACVCQRHGKMDLLFQCVCRALAATQEGGLVGRHAFDSVFLAAAKVLVGELSCAREHLESAVTLLIDMPAVRILRSAVGLQLGLLLDDEELVRCYSDWETVELAFRSAESYRIATIVPRFVDLLIKHRKLSQARGLLQRAVLAIDNSYECGELLTQVAAHGDVNDVPTARSLLVASIKGDDDIVGRAFLELFKAQEANRRSNRRRQAATAHGLAASAIFAKIDWPIFQAQGLECAGRVSDALAIYRRIGADGEVRRLNQKLSLRNQRGRYGMTLTERQHDVAGLVAQRLSNREIAGELGISEHTVEHHLESIFNRLGIRSREELTEKIARIP